MRNLFYSCLLVVLLATVCAQTKITILEPGASSYIQEKVNLYEKFTLRGQVESDIEIEGVEINIYDSKLGEKGSAIEAELYFKEDSSKKVAIFQASIALTTGNAQCFVKAYLQGNKNFTQRFSFLNSATNAQYDDDFTKIISKLVHKDAIAALCFTHDNRFLVSGGDDKMIKLIDPRSLKVVRTMRGHKGYIKTLAVTPDDKYIVSGSSDKSVRIWELETGKSLKILRGHTSEIHCLAISHDGKYAVSGADSAPLILWDLEKREKVRTFEYSDSSFLCLNFSKDNRYCISGDDDNAITIWDITTGEDLYRRSSAHDNPVTSVVMHPSMRYMYSGDRTGWVKWWQILLDANITDASWDDESHIMWEMRLHQIKKRARDIADITDMARVTKKIREYPLYEIDTALADWVVPYEGETIHPYNNFSTIIRCLGLSGNGQFLLIVSEKGKVRIFETVTGIKRFSSFLSRDLTSGTFSYDGTLAAVGDNNGRIDVYGLP